MQGEATLIMCDSCGREVPDRASKEVIYQVDKLRYRFELCPNCLDEELERHDGHRGIPGFRKRAAILIGLDKKEGLPYLSRR